MRPGAVVERFREALDEVDLTADQKIKVDKAFEELREKAKGAGLDREQLRDAADGLRRKLLEILTPAQRESVREKLGQAMRAGPGRGDGRKREAGGPPAVKAGPTTGPSDAMMSGDDRMMGSTMGGAAGGTGVSSGSAGGGRRNGAGDSVSPKSPIVAIGAAAPDLTAKRMDGTAFKIATFRNRPLVLIFGSYSSPTFRDKAPLLAELAQDYRGKADFFVVYTAEAYPAGDGDKEIDRNREDKVSIEQPKTDSARMAQAKATRAALKLESIPFLVDDMANGSAKAYTHSPNAVVVISKDGTVAARQDWADPFTLRGLIDEAAR